MANKLARNVFFKQTKCGGVSGYEIIRGLSDCIHVGGFISGIKVYADADEHGSKRKMILSAYLQILQAIVVKDTVIIKPLTNSTLTVDGPVLFCPLGMRGYKRRSAWFFM